MARPVLLLFYQFESLVFAFALIITVIFFFVRTGLVCSNFHLHHTLPSAQKIELAILYCCCCCKLSNCCNLPPSNLSKEQKIISTYHTHGFVTVFVGLAGYQPFCKFFLQLILLLLLPPHSSLFFFYFFFFFSLILDTTRSS